MRLLCIDVGGTFLKYAIIESGRIQGDVARTPTPRDSLPSFVDAVVAIYQKMSAVTGFEGIALSMPGMIETDTGFMRTGGSLDFIHDLPFAQILSDRCDGIPVNIENDAKAAATAEMESGVLKNYNNAIILTIGTAIGGTVIVNRKILRGINLFAGEVSYMIYEDTVPRQMWGSRGIPKKMVEYYGDETILSEEVLSRMEKGDAQAKNAVRMTARELAHLIYNLQCVLDPEIIAIGGGISAQKSFIQMVQEENGRLISDINLKFPPTVIKPCKYLNDANLLGACYAMEAKYKPLQVQKRGLA